MFGIEEKVANTAKRAGFLSGGLLLCSVGGGFLTVAAWLALVPTVGAQLTATIIAGVYLGLGFILLGLSAKGSDQKADQTPKQTDADVAAPPIVQAFMYGLQAGAQAEQKRH